MDGLEERVAMEGQQERGRLSSLRAGEVLFEPVWGTYHPAEDGVIEVSGYHVVHRGERYLLAMEEEEKLSDRSRIYIRQQLQQQNPTEAVSSLGLRYVTVIDAGQKTVAPAGPEIEQRIAESEQQYSRLYQGLEEAVEQKEYRKVANI